MAVGDKVYAEYGRRVEGSRHVHGDTVTLAITGELDMHVLVVGGGPDGETDLGTSGTTRFVHLTNPSDAQEKRAMAHAIRLMHEDLDRKRDTHAETQRAIERGRAQVEAGNVHDMEDVLAEMDEIISGDRSRS